MPDHCDPDDPCTECRLEADDERRAAREWRQHNRRRAGDDLPYRFWRDYATSGLSRDEWDRTLGRLADEIAMGEHDEPEDVAPTGVRVCRWLGRLTLRRRQPPTRGGLPVDPVLGLTPTEVAAMIGGAA